MIGRARRTMNVSTLFSSAVVVEDPAAVDLQDPLEAELILAIARW